MQTISIIIPTMGVRQELLARSINSTRVESNKLLIELVLVVNGTNSANFKLPNGIELRENQYLKVIRTNRSCVSLARNIGIENACGDFIRFLDDDDFLIPQVAEKQYLDLIKSSADISTYAGQTQDELGFIFQTIIPDGSNGYACAVLGEKCPALTFASVYRSCFIESVRWNEEWSTTEDEDWMRRILQKSHPKWIFSNSVVGFWYQHQEARLSKPLPINSYYANRAISIIETIKKLKYDNRLGNNEKKAAAQGLWSAIHGGFYFSPIFWTKISKIALDLDKDSRPQIYLFRKLDFFHPLLIEWAMLPKRLLNHTARVIKEKLYGLDYVRKI